MRLFCVNDCKIIYRIDIFTIYLSKSGKLNLQVVYLH